MKRGKRHAPKNHKVTAMQVEMNSIGIVRTDAKTVPHFWADSDVEGTLIIDDMYAEGLQGLQRGDMIIVIFYFHKSRAFTSKDLIQHPRGNAEREKKGVFDICSPIRPNPIGMSVVKIIDIRDNTIYIKGIDMIDGTPVLDIKPFRHF